MGVIGTLFGAGRAAREVGAAVGGVAEIFVGNTAERDAAAAAGFAATVGQYGAEFAAAGGGRFDRFVNALNRLPRPMLALGTLGLFAYAMAEPAGFSVRMQGLNLVPEQLWWLLGAIVSFYFGARELHHQRSRGAVSAARALVTGARGDLAASADDARAPVSAPAAVAEAVAEAVTASVEEHDAPAARTLAKLPARTAANDPDHNAAVEEWRSRRA